MVFVCKMFFLFYLDFDGIRVQNVLPIFSSPTGPPLRGPEVLQIVPQGVEVPELVEEVELLLGEGVLVLAPGHLPQDDPAEPLLAALPGPGGQHALLLHDPPHVVPPHRPVPPLQQLPVQDVVHDPPLLLLGVRVALPLVRAAPARRLRPPPRCPPSPPARPCCPPPAPPGSARGRGRAPAH